MMEAEKIKKALGCCANAYDCFTCDNYERHCIGGFRTAIAQNALALITEQEQKIKELTEERERLHASCTELTQALHEFLTKIAEIKKKYTGDNNL